MVHEYGHRFGFRDYANVALSSICWLGTMTAAAPATAVAERPSSADPKIASADAKIAGYTGEDVMIPMRDGVFLHAQIWRPKAAGPLPILFQRSPYSFSPTRVRSAFATEYKALAHDGFIFVLEDIRGRFGSQGRFVMLRPTAQPGETDESTDTFDSIAWAIRHIPDNNGKVGVFGLSYLGWTTAMATINPHPALKAVSIQASPEDMFLGDDFHHNGAFRLDYGWEYAAALETDGRTTQAFSFDHEDTYAWYLKQPRLADLDTRVLGQTLPTWRNFVDHPAYDAYHQAQVTSAQLSTTVTIPNLMVAGWWDQEDFYGPLTIYQRQSPGAGEKRNYLVIGPWNHGGWARSDGRNFGPFDLGSATAEYFRNDVELPWFRYWLKGEGALDQLGALVFETGSNRWRRYSAWPPRDGVTKKSLYLHSGGRLSFDPPQVGEGDADQFVSDPANPVPYRQQPIDPTMIEGSTWPVWLADDQTPLSTRRDVLTWRTDPLREAITIRGDAIAQLYASTTGTDADWVVKLIDVYPLDATTPAEVRGRQLIIADEVFRGRFRKSFSTPEALPPNTPLDYTIDLHTASHVFEPGHRIAVQVQSSWFPLIDRNPQTFVPNILQAARSAFKAQTHAVFHTPERPTAIVVDVASAPAF